jgi:transmembrane 9 superfamily protein 2/4
VHSPSLSPARPQAIQRQYHHNWIIDNLPAASILDTDQYVSTQYVGYPIGESV